MRPAASGEAFALEIPFLAYSPAADGAHRQNKVAPAAKQNRLLRRFGAENKKFRA
jgi:hypothetical protein